MITPYTLSESQAIRRFGFVPSAGGRMFCYAWIDVARPDETKVGERWVKAGLDPELDCWQRIRDSLGVQKTKVDEGKVKIVAIWDMSTYGAIAAPNKLKPHGKMDDEIRPCIGARIGTSEIHALPYDIAVANINAHIASVGVSAKPSITPRARQAATVDQVILAAMAAVTAERDVLSVVANLCPRFGKTVWALMIFEALGRLFGTNLMVVPVYWLSVMTSFANEASKYADCDNIVVVKFSDPGAEDRADTAIRSGKRVLALVSLCGDLSEDLDEATWVKKHRWLLKYDRSKTFLFADEADFGSHTPAQQRKLELLTD